VNSPTPADAVRVPHSWELEDHEIEDLLQSQELAADDAGENLGDAP